jgi:hypothetical protein
MLDRAVSLNVAGGGSVKVEVYDMLFAPNQVDEGTLTSDWAHMMALPPVYRMESDIATGEGEFLDDPGRETTPGSGSSDRRPPGGVDPRDVNPLKYGAYLVRAKLYDHNGKLVRTAEEAFVQVFN